MTPQPARSPLTATQLVDEYFIETRNRIIEVAAFLDRIDRTDPAVSEQDFRVQALADAINVLAGPGPNRVREIQILMSDPTTEPLPALDRKGAVGAYDRSKQEVR
ncbi:MAG: hypothetical protein ABI634_05540 [Acidobacteriota bacterium]